MAINQLNLGNALASAAQTAGTVNHFKQQNKLRDLYAQMGPGIMQGDPQALNALAAIDPMAGMEIMRTRAADTRAKELHGWRGAEHTATMDAIAQKAAAEAMKQTEAENLRDLEDFTSAAQLLQGEPNEAAFRRVVSRMAQEEGNEGVLEMPFTPETWSQVSEIVNGVRVGLLQATRQPDALLAKAATPETANVGARQIYKNGTVIQSTPQGPVVWSPDRRRLEGQEAVDAINAANEYEVQHAESVNFGRQAGTNAANIDSGGMAAGSREAGTQAIKMSKDAFEALGKVQKNIANLTQVVDLIKKGAQTGPLAQYLPNITSASQEMMNMQSRLGLDVVGAVTFGALSEGELNLALSTALPIGLPEEDLKQWTVDKIEAQTKLATYLEEQARFLSKPGNTLNEWLEQSAGTSGFDLPSQPVAGAGNSQAQPVDLQGQDRSLFEKYGVPIAE